MTSRENDLYGYNQMRFTTLCGGLCQTAPRSSQYVPYEKKNLIIPSENKIFSSKPSGFIQTSDLISSISELPFMVANAVLFQKFNFGC